MSPLILHLPHASAHIPDRKFYVATENQIQAELLQLTDWYTDDLFNAPAALKVVAPFSRLFCDVERFADDELEVMAAKGMGMMYTLLDDGSPLRMPDAAHRNRILESHYRPHHQRLEAAVNRLLQTAGSALIVDGHSFPDTPLQRDLDQRADRPDFNIGTDPFHTPPELVSYARAFFAARNYTLGIDWPYAGSLVPMAHYQRNRQVHSIMLEINRRLYLEPGSNRKSSQYPKIRSVVTNFLKGIEQI